MDAIAEALRLLKSSDEISSRAANRGEITIEEEQHLLVIGNRLQRYPAAVSAIERTVAARQLPIQQVSIADVLEMEAGSTAA